MKEYKTPADLVDEFAEALKEQLEDDNARWGGTWKIRPKEGQEKRTQARFNDYFDQFENGSTPVPWLKIAGGALICWARETGLIETGENDG